MFLDHVLLSSLLSSYSPVSCTNSQVGRDFMQYDVQHADSAPDWELCLNWTRQEAQHHNRKLKSFKIICGLQQHSFWSLFYIKWNTLGSTRDTPGQPPGGWMQYWSENGRELDTVTPLCSGIWMEWLICVNLCQLILDQLMLCIVWRPSEGGVSSVCPSLSVPPAVCVSR